MRLGNGDARTRQRIASWVTGLSIAGIALTSGMSIVLADDQDRPEMARLVFASVLPLFGTWVGTVLAFYFARENLQAATDSTIRLAGRFEMGTPVSEVMIPRERMHTYDLRTNQDSNNLKIVDLQNSMLEARVRRIPILTELGAVVYVVHDSTIAKFADSVGKKPSDLHDEVMAELLEAPGLGAQVKAIGFVGPDADLGQARTAMRSVKECNDVFVTKQGQRDDPVVGWLTNTQLAGLE